MFDLDEIPGTYTNGAELSNSEISVGVKSRTTDARSGVIRSHRVARLSTVAALITVSALAFGIGAASSEIVLPALATDVQHEPDIACDSRVFAATRGVGWSWQELMTRRSQLIVKRHESGLDPQESDELRYLEDLVDEFIDEVAPLSLIDLPVDASRVSS